MGLYRNNLPQLSGKPFITDGGLETTLIFHQGVELPAFASFTLLTTASGREKLKDYFETYIELAKKYQTGIILETPTWRASSDWGQVLGHSDESLTAINQLAVNELIKLRNAHSTPSTPVVVSGNIGPRGDGYIPGKTMNSEEAQRYHQKQIADFARTEADLVCAMTINYIEEAIGIVRAARAEGMPVCISFTVETDGLLPTGDSLQKAIETVDMETAAYPVYYMVNCAHPTHFKNTLKHNENWVQRIHAVRANASKCSHAELNEATELDAGDPEDLADQYVLLKDAIKNLSIFGGCCGTDHRHIEKICQTCL